MVTAVPRQGRRYWWSAPGVPEVADVAVELNLPLTKHDALHSTDFDLLLSVYWSRAFPAEVLDRAAVAVNLHTAPLPECRGRYSCSVAIAEGDKEFGPTLHIMKEEVDTGPIFATSRFMVSDLDTARTLYDKTNQASEALLTAWMPVILNGRLLVEEQEAYAERTGSPIRKYGADALERYLAADLNRIDGHRLDRLRRALTFPPRYLPPSVWPARIAAPD